MALLTQQELLNILDRLFPVGYLDPLKNPGPGYELFRAAAAVGERASLAVSRTEADCLLTLAHGGAFGEVWLRFERLHGLAGAQTVKAGTLISTYDSITYRLQEDAVFTDGDTVALPNPVRAVAVSESYSFNLPGPFHSADGTLVAGDVNNFALLILDPPFTPGAAPITITQVSAATGGADAALDRLGSDLGMPRAAGESDDNYRARLRQLPDTVSPGAVLRAVSRFLEPYGVYFSIIETFARSYQTCWDAVDTDFPPQADLGEYDPTTFVYDDPRPPIPFRGRWLSTVDQRCSLIVVVGQLPSIQQYSIGYDDTAMNQAALTSVHGVRATAAYDLSVAASGVKLPGFYDGSLFMGMDAPAAAIYKGLLALLKRVTAGGISVNMVLAGGE